MVANLDICHTLTNRLDDTSTLVAEDDWESTFGILS